MIKCEVCNKQYNSESEDRYKCSIGECKRWLHVECAITKQISDGDGWFCKTHKEDIEKLLMEGESLSEVEEVLQDIDKSREDSRLNQEAKNTSKTNGELQFHSLLNTQIINDDESSKEINIESKKSHNLLTKNVSRERIVPYNDGNDYNPFANFSCESCSEQFTKENRGVLCKDCRSVFHLSCLNTLELDGVIKSKFICQDCIENRLRLENLKVKQREHMRRNNNVPDNSLANSNSQLPFNLAASTPRIEKSHKTINEKKAKKKSKKVTLKSSSSDDDSSASSDKSLSSDDSVVKRSHKKKKLSSKSSSNSSSSSSESSSDSDNEVSKSKAICKLYKYTQEERKKAKFEKLPIVERADMKWKVFYDLFKESRKAFCHSENILRIQNSIKIIKVLGLLYRGT